MKVSTGGSNLAGWAASCWPPDAPALWICLLQPRYSFTSMMIGCSEYFVIFSTTSGFGEWLLYCLLLLVHLVEFTSGYSAQFSDFVIQVRQGCSLSAAAGVADASGFSWLPLISGCFHEDSCLKLSQPRLLILKRRLTVARCSLLAHLLLHGCLTHLMKRESQERIQA